MEMLAGTQPIAILLTHTHPDHVGALQEMRERLQVPLLAHPGPHFQGMALATDRAIADGEIISVGQHTLKAHYAPGHIDDMICFAVVGGNDIIVGDTHIRGRPRQHALVGSVPDHAAHTARCGAALAGRVDLPRRPRPIVPAGRQARRDRGVPGARPRRFLRRRDMGDRTRFVSVSIHRCFALQSRYEYYLMHHVLPIAR